MHTSGQLAARALATVEPHIKPGVTTAHLDEMVHNFIYENGATAATLAGTLHNNRYVVHHHFNPSE